MEIKEKYNQLGFETKNFKLEIESKEYEACSFNNSLGRTAKKTPKKSGLFVTVWKRINNGPIEPFHEEDNIESVLVLIEEAEKKGYFQFPADILIQKGIISTTTKEGKRAFRLYPPWTITTSKQAARTQKWQIEYFTKNANL